MSSSWRKKMRVKWNRGLDGSSGSSREEPLGVFERQGSLRKPSSVAGKEEPFKRSWSFRLGGKDTKDVKEPKDGKDHGDKSMFLRMFRFGKDKRKASLDGVVLPSRRRMSDAGGTATSSAAKDVIKEELSQWSSVPVELSESPEVQRRQEIVLMRAHTLPRSLDAPPVGGGGDGVEGSQVTDGNVWGVIYCDPRPDSGGGGFKVPRVKLESTPREGAKETTTPRESPGNNEAAENEKVLFSGAVVPHFLRPADEEDGGREREEDKRGLKKLLLNGNCLAGSEHGAVAALGGREAVVLEDSGGCAPMDWKEDAPQSAHEAVENGSGSVDSGCSRDLQLCPDSADIVAVNLKDCEYDEPASNATFVVEVNEGYEEEEVSDESCPLPESIPNGHPDGELPLPDAQGRRLQNGYAKNPITMLGCTSARKPTDSAELAMDAKPMNQDYKSEDDCDYMFSAAVDPSGDGRQSRCGSVSTNSNCEECPAQDEFEFVAAEPFDPKRHRRTSRDTMSPPVSDVSDDEFPADERASFIYLKPDCPRESVESPLSTPDEAPVRSPLCDATGKDVQDEQRLRVNGIQGICSDSDLDLVDLDDDSAGAEEEREVIIVGHLADTSPTDRYVVPNAMVEVLDCCESNASVDLTASQLLSMPPEICVNGVEDICPVIKVENDKSTSRATDCPENGPLRRPEPQQVDVPASEVDGHRTPEPEGEVSLKDKINFFNSMSSGGASAEPPVPTSRRGRMISRIPTASRLPRPSAKFVKKEPCAPAHTPVPAKRSRLGKRTALIPQPSTRSQAQQKQPGTNGAEAETCPVKASSTKMKAVVKPVVQAPMVPLVQGSIEVNASAVPEGSGQLKRSGTFVLDDSEPMPEAQPESLAARCETESTATAARLKDDGVEYQTLAIVEDVEMRVANEKMSTAVFSVCSVQVPVVDSTETTEVSDENLEICVCCREAKKGAPGSTARGASSPVSGYRPKVGSGPAGHVPSQAEFTKEIQRLGALCESRTKELNLLKLQLRHASTGFTSFGIVIQHLSEVQQHDSFTIPKLSEELRKSRLEIEQARAAIEQYKVDIEEMKCHQEERIEAMKGELATSHSAKLKELEEAHKNELACYLECHTKKIEELKSLYTDIIEGDRKSHLETMDSLKQRHREKIDAINEEYTIELESINQDHAVRQAELDSKHAELLQQYKTLQNQAKEFQESVLQDTDTKIQWLSKKNKDLEKEVESLNVVLEMRSDKIQSLQRCKLEMERKGEELERCRVKMEKMEARIEDLQELLNEKVKLQSQLSVENAKLRETSEKQNRKLSRLDMRNEELSYKLRESANVSYIRGCRQTVRRKTPLTQTM
uniref:Putative microtubule associated tumor suppressor candidate 2 n=1 Tax=Ixodes ricinus TaxID=34613 RepID=A0A6B0VI98_IXORI